MTLYLEVICINYFFNSLIVFSEFKERLLNRLRIKREAKPLVSTHDDLALIRKVKGKKMPGLSQIGHIKKILSSQEKRIISLCVLVMVIGFGLFGFDLFKKNTVNVPTVGGRYTEAIIGSPQLVNPIFAAINDVDMDLVSLIFSGLMKYDKDQKLNPDLAESFEISEDKKTYTFHLRHDVVWHDGSPFTAKDVVFTFQTIQDPAVGSPLYVTFKDVVVEASDDYTVKFALNEPFASFTSTLTVGIIPESVWFDILPDRIRLHKQNLQPVGTGSFMFKKLVKDEAGYIKSYELERFDKYYNKPSLIKEFVLKFFAEYEGSDGALQALRGQRVDGLSFIPHDMRNKVERKYIDLHTLQLPQYTALFFNQQGNAILKENKVRTALAQAIDKERILREVLKNEGQIIDGPILPGFPGYSPEIAKTEHSVDKANEALDKIYPRVLAKDYVDVRRAAIMKEIGYTTSTEAITPTETASSTESNESTSTAREFAEQQIEERLKAEINDAQVFYRKNDKGEFLELNLVTANTKEYMEEAEFIAGFWQEIGIKTNVDLVEPKEFSRNVLKDRKYDVLLYGVVVGSDPDQYPLWHSSQTAYPGLNFAQYINRNVDALIEKARKTDDIDEQTDSYKKFQEIILNEHPAVFLYMPTYTYATTNIVKGVDIVRIFHPSDRFANVTDWYIKTKTKIRK